MNFFFSKFWRRPESTRQYVGLKFVNSISDIPADVGNEIYIVGNPTAAKWAVFDCPCAKGHKLTVNLMKSARPRWRIRFFKNKISLDPSIVVTDQPCHSHFWLESNRVYPAFFDVKPKR